ncbi:MAG TPA: UvrD-helicase domain-containing protein [Gemmatimonadales bacterium]|nr:UvrD-helicase domain-containing protein [Gemmatimonadales bacterium]
MSFEPTLQQRKAIEAPLGPVLVVAGPGAGKTYCLICRVQHLISGFDLAPRRILAVTFTNKAAEEIAGRLCEARGRTNEDVTRGTLHALCFKILRDFALRAGLRPGFGIADQEYQLGVLKRLRVPERRRAEVLSRFGLYRLQGRPLGEKGSELLARYEERLRSRNLADFDDLVVLTERLLRTDAAAAAELRARWDYLLVDEFQDLSPVQYGIIRRLAEGHRNVFGVGDDEQSIFSWAGSDPRIIHQFREDFNLGQPIVLDRNCRCSTQIFATAKRLIACNPRLFEKDIEATRDSPYQVAVQAFDTEDDEASWLIEDLHRDRQASGLGWGEYALLYRSHRVGRHLEERLVCAGVPCRLAQGHALTDDKIVGWVLSSLQVIRAPEDPVRLGILAEHALPGPLRQEVKKSFSKDKDLATNLRGFAASRPRGDADARRVWRLIYHLENLRGMARSHQSLSGLVDELLARPIGAGRNPLEEHHHDLSDPATYPGAAFLATQLWRAVQTGQRVRVEASRGMEIPLAAMLRAGGVPQATRLDAKERRGEQDLVLRAGDGSHGWPLRLFKALQLIQTRGLRSDFDDFVAFDIETSDFDINSCEIVEIAAVRVRKKVVVDRFHTLVACSQPIAPRATDVHGYTDRDLIGAPCLPEVWSRFRAFVGSDLLVAHNGQEFDVPVLRRLCAGSAGLDDLVFYDTLPLARSLVEGSARLTELAARFNVEVGRAHHAFDDAYMLAGVVPALNELRMRRARKIAAVNLLDQLGLALALDTQPATAEEESLFRDIARPFTLGRYSDCLECYAAELTRGAQDAPSLEQVIDRLGGPALMERLRAERPMALRYPVAVERLRMLVQASVGDTVGDQIDDLLSRASLSSSAGVDTDPNRINLLTLHSTKGLEFSRVYIVGVENQQLPGWKALEENIEEEIQEARRLLYVGMTRAKDRLVVTRAERRGGLPSGGSLFLTEAGLAGSDVGIPPALALPATSK